MKKPDRCYKCAQIEFAHKNEKHNFISDRSVRKKGAPSKNLMHVLHYGDRYAACGREKGITVSFYYMVTCKRCRRAAITRATMPSVRHVMVPPVFGEIARPLCFPSELVMRPNFYFLYGDRDNPSSCSKCWDIQVKEVRRIAKTARRDAKARARLEKQKQQREPEERASSRRRTPIREKRAQQRAGMGRALRPKDRRKAGSTRTRSRS